MYKTAKFLKDIMIIWLDAHEKQEEIPLHVHFAMEITIENAYAIGLVTKNQAKIGKDFNNELLEFFSEEEPPFDEDE